MKWIASIALCALTLGGCAAGGSIYEYRPTDSPLRYRIRDSATLHIETPVGEQLATDSTHTAIAIEVAGSTDGGREVLVSFEGLEHWSGGDFPSQHVVGNELAGQSLGGVLRPSGDIELTDRPEMSEGLAAAIDPTALVARLLPPLPDDGEFSAAPWPHRSTVTVSSAMSVELTYDGTASFAGDTTLDGRSARIIVSEGIMTASGHGRPAGAPGEVDFNYTGRYMTRHVWDPASGVMLASVTTSDAEGELAVREMQLVMPVTRQGRRAVTLAR